MILKTLYRKLLSQLDSKRTLMLSLLGGILLTALVQSFDMNLFEAFLYDFRVRTRSSTPTEKLNTVIVTIDDRTIDALGEYAPLSMKSQHNLLKFLGEAHPRAIAYLIDFNDSVAPQASSPANHAQATNDDADAFVTLAETLAQAGTPVWLGTDVDVTGEVLPPYPLSKLPHRAALIHKDGTNFSEDKVTRRAVFSIYDEPVLHVELASLLTGSESAKNYNGIYYMPEVEANYFLINYTGKTQDKLHPFLEISAIDLLQGKVSADLLKDKIVLIGTKTQENSSDYAYTPYSRAIFTNSKLVIHANIVETLIRDDAILVAPKSFDALLTLLLTTLVIAMVFRTTPERGVVTTILGSFLLVCSGVLVFRAFHFWVNLSHPLIGISGAYYIFVPYRLIVEYKKRWDIQKKHEVLVQIEELKSNFMSLITHDLKTPVARIQGMAEILVKSGGDSKIVSEILGSTDELNRFISSILELATIESNKVKLIKQSKDVNKVIEDCVRKFSFSAQSRQISLFVDLEPLFPIRIDTTLMTKVISNLIDNAIKYSPDNSSLKITSLESKKKPGYIEINIQDTGHGIAKKEIDNLFSKFYRPKNDLTLVTKGTGLGLYLSRYFVELHKGTLTLQSEEGRGSTFTILLPMDDTVIAEDESKKSFSRNMYGKIKGLSKKEARQNGGISHV